ncbi:MAG TPA: hypothetical protein VJ351_08090 [Streptosporangiaceae bacterium]|nr:hypothetical protein [Streptosporangiaceae bacterium]
MTADMSVAPEIARLAEAVLLIPAGHTVPGTPTASPADFPESHAEHTLTVGTLAGRLRSIAASPERWWGLVRFEPDRPVQITVEECAAYRAWLMVLPPGDAGQSCDCDVATMIAGEATEGTSASAVLRPGPVRVHGERHGERHDEGHGKRHGEQHGLLGRGTGYSISLHARANRSSTQR